MNRGPAGDRPDWLSLEAARAIAEAAGAVRGRRRDSPDGEKAALRAAATGCLPSLPAHMLAEVAETLAPADPALSKHALPSVATAEPGRLARRLAALGGGANVPPGAVAERLAAAHLGRGQAIAELLTGFARSVQRRGVRARAAAACAPDSSGCG